MQDINQYFGCLLPHLVFCQRIGGRQQFHIIRFPAGSQIIQFIDDTGLHLVRRLIRKGHGKDTTKSARPRK